MVRSLALLAAVSLGCGFQLQASGGDVGSDGGSGSDGAPDVDAPSAPADAAMCFGSSVVRVCLATLPTQLRQLTADTTIDTGTSPLCEATTNPEAARLCVISGVGIEILGGVSLRGRGSKPLVLVSTTTIVIAGTLDVASRPTQIGANSNPDLTACPTGTQATNGGSSGGGYGGSFGGNGANGESNDGGVGGISPPAATTVGSLRGGCDGGTSIKGGVVAAGGRGGGAVGLIAAGSLTVSGVINASGQGGRLGNIVDQGAGGGGSGGMIVLDAESITNLGEIFANGGGGGEGNDNYIGEVGHEPINATTRAAPGAGTTTSGGNGGAGSLGGAGGAPPGNANSSGGGGGGGGGGTGVVKAIPVMTGAGAVSPSP